MSLTSQEVLYIVIAEQALHFAASLFVHCTQVSFNRLQSEQSSVGPAGNSLIARNFLQYKQVVVSVVVPSVGSSFD